MDSSTLQELRNQRSFKARCLSEALDNQRAHGYRLVGLAAAVDEAKVVYNAALRRRDEIRDEVSCLRGEVESLDLQIGEHEELS